MRRSILLCLLLIIAGATLAAELDSGFYDDDAAMLVYTGTWSEATNAVANGGAYYESASPDASLTFETRAISLTVYYLSHAGGPDVTICVDADCSTISTAGSDAATSAELSGLTTGLKTVSITSDVGLRFDGLYIHPLPQPETTPEPFVQSYSLQDSSGGDFAGQLLIEMTAGDVLILSALVILILLTGISITLQVVRNG